MISAKQPSNSPWVSNLEGLLIPSKVTQYRNLKRLPGGRERFPTFLLVHAAFVGELHVFIAYWRYILGKFILNLAYRSKLTLPSSSNLLRSKQVSLSSIMVFLMLVQFKGFSSLKVIRVP